MTATLPARTGATKKKKQKTKKTPSALTERSRDKELLVDWTQQDQATDQRQSLESKKTFRLQKSKKKKKNYDKNNFEKAAEYKT